MCTLYEAERYTNRVASEGVDPAGHGSNMIVRLTEVTRSVYARSPQTYVS